MARLLHSQAKALSCTRTARQAAAEREQRGVGGADTVAEVVGGAGASSVAAAMGSATESAAEMEVDPAGDGTTASSKKRKGSAHRQQEHEYKLSKVGFSVTLVQLENIGGHSINQLCLQRVARQVKKQDDSLHCKPKPRYGVAELRAAVISSMKSSGMSNVDVPAE